MSDRVEIENKKSEKEKAETSNYTNNIFDDISFAAAAPIPVCIIHEFSVLREFKGGENLNTRALYPSGIPRRTPSAFLSSSTIDVI